MDGQFWKIFATLFGIGAAVSLAKSLKSKKPMNEVISELILTGIFSLVAGAIYLVYPAAPVIAVVGIGSLLAVLGVTFFADKLEKVLDRYLPPKTP